MKTVPPMSFSTRIRCVLAVFDYLCFALGGSVLSLVLLLIRPLMSARLRVHVGSRMLQCSWKLMCCLLSLTRNLSLRTPDRSRMAALRGSVIVANHPSLIDVVILASIIPGCKLVVSPKLMRWRFLRPILHGLCIINNGDVAYFLSQAEECLEQGFNIIIFPEGTRTTPGVRSRIHRGAARLSMLTERPLIPIRIQTDMPFLTKDYPGWYVGEHCPEFVVTMQAPICGGMQPGESAHAACVRLSREIAERILPDQEGAGSAPSA